MSTVGYAPFGRGAIYALDAATGAVRWKFVTIEEPWRYPLEAGGGGLWYPVSVDAQGRLYAGNSNPSPWGGTPERPNGAAFPGPVPYTDSLLVLDARTGRLLWYDQVTPHDVRDYDFEATPILATVEGDELVFGAGKAGRVIAWDRETRRRRWTTAVGLHRNDLGPLPRRRVTVCPGLLGGVETPMAYADGRLFVPVVDLCGWGSAIARQELTSRRSVAREGPARRARRRDGARPVGAAPALARLRLRDGLERRRLHVHLRRDGVRVRRRRREARLAHADARGRERVPCGGRRLVLFGAGDPRAGRRDARDRRVRPALTPAGYSRPDDLERVRRRQGAAARERPQRHAVGDRAHVRCRRRSCSADLELGSVGGRRLPSPDCPGSRPGAGGRCSSRMIVPAGSRSPGAAVALLASAGLVPDRADEEADRHSVLAELQRQRPPPGARVGPPATRSVIFAVLGAATVSCRWSSGASRRLPSSLPQGRREHERDEAERE